MFGPWEGTRRSFVGGSDCPRGREARPVGVELSQIFARVATRVARRRAACQAMNRRRRSEPLSAGRSPVGLRITNLSKEYRWCHANERGPIPPSGHANRVGPGQRSERPSENGRARRTLDFVPHPGRRLLRMKIRSHGRRACPVSPWLFPFCALCLVVRSEVATSACTRSRRWGRSRSEAMGQPWPFVISRALEAADGREHRMRCKGLEPSSLRATCSSSDAVDR